MPDEDDSHTLRGQLSAGVQDPARRPSAASSAEEGKNWERVRAMLKVSVLHLWPRIARLNALSLSIY